MCFAARCNEVCQVSASLPLHPARLRSESCAGKSPLQTSESGSGEKRGVLHLLGSTQERAGGSQGLNHGTPEYPLVPLSRGVDVGPRHKARDGTGVVWGLLGLPHARGRAVGGSCLHRGAEQSRLLLKPPAAGMAGRVLPESGSVMAGRVPGAVPSLRGGRSLHAAEATAAGQGGTCGAGEPGQGGN